MKLAEYLSLRGASLDTAADEIGDVSVSGLRKWLSEDRVPRPDQMRRIYEWSGGEVSPNDFVLDHLCVPSPSRGENGATATACHVNANAPSLLPEGAPR